MVVYVVYRELVSRTIPIYQAIAGIFQVLLPSNKMILNARKLSYTVSEMALARKPIIK